MCTLCDIFVNLLNLLASYHVHGTLTSRMIIDAYCVWILKLDFEDMVLLMCFSYTVLVS